MSGWWWLPIGLLVWLVVSVPVAILIGKFIAIADRDDYR